jgi:hypothetical protein
MGNNPQSGKKPDKSRENDFQKNLYVPEDQLFQRIPLCRYLSDLSELFENEETGDEPAGKTGQKERP